MGTTNIVKWLEQEDLTKSYEVVDVLRALEDEYHEGEFESVNYNGKKSLRRYGGEDLILSSEKAINFFVSLVREKAGIPDTKSFEEWGRCQ